MTRKGQSGIVTSEWAKHLKKFEKRKVAKRERRDAKKEIRKEK